MDDRNIIIEIPQGLGDAVYCYPILKELAITRYKNYGIYIYRNPHKIIFEPLKKYCNLLDAAPINSLVLKIHYRQRRFLKTTQYEDLVISAKLPNPPHFIFDWDKKFTDKFSENVLSKIKRHYLIVKEPCAAHMHKNINKQSVDPDPKFMQEYVDFYRKSLFIISVGQNEKFSHRLKNIDLDLVDRIDNIEDYINLVKHSSVILTQAGHLVPLAQAFNRRHRIFYPANNRFPYIRPEKLNQLFSKNYKWKK